MITFCIDKQHIRRTDSDKVVSGAVGFVKFRADYSEEWSGFNVTFSFECRDRIYYVFNVEAGKEYVVPSETLAAPGSVKVSCFGANSDNTIATSDFALLDVAEGAQPEREGSESAPTEPLFNQMLSMVENAADSLELAKGEDAVLWRTGGGEWHRLIELSEITGETGPAGPSGNDGTDGRDAHLYIRYSAEMPTSDEEIKDTPDAYIGIYSGTANSAPESYTEYCWYRFKGNIPTADEIPLPDCELGENAAEAFSAAEATLKKHTADIQAKADRIVLTKPAAYDHIIDDAGNYPIVSATLIGTMERSVVPAPTAPIYPTYCEQPTISDNVDSVQFSDITLRAFEGYRDAIIISDGRVVLRREVGHRELDGTESMTQGIPRYTLPQTRAVSTDAMVTCSHYPTSSSLSDKCVRYTAWNSQILMFLDNDYATGPEFKSFAAAQYAAGNPISIEWPLANATESDITDTPAGTAALMLHTTEGISTITSSTLCEVSYHADTTKAYNKLKNAIIALGGSI